MLGFRPTWAQESEFSRTCAPGSDSRKSEKIARRPATLKKSDVHARPARLDHIRYVRISYLTTGKVNRPLLPSTMSFAFPKMISCLGTCFIRRRSIRWRRSFLRPALPKIYIRPIARPNLHVECHRWPATPSQAEPLGRLERIDLRLIKQVPKQEIIFGNANSLWKAVADGSLFQSLNKNPNVSGCDRAGCRAWTSLFLMCRSARYFFRTFGYRFPVRTSVRNSLSWARLGEIPT